MRDNIYKTLATLGFIGYLPYAPGTWGSAVGFLLVLLAKPSDHILFLLVLILFITGVVASDRAEKSLGKDSGHIIIDELTGYFAAALFVPKTLGYLAAVFVLFRIFDVLKPPPVSNVEKAVPGGAGVMLDDIFAAVYTNICLQIWLYFS